VRLRDLRPGDAGWVLARHGHFYAEDAGFDARFEILVARVLADLLERRLEDAARGWIAEGPDGAPLGCVFYMRRDPETAQLRLFFVEPSARGVGLGRRLLAACLAHAREEGAARLVLWTHESHRAACALYAASGFVCTGSAPTHAFGQPLVEQCWEIPLAGLEPFPPRA